MDNTQGSETLVTTTVMRGRREESYAGPLWGLVIRLLILLLLLAGASWLVIPAWYTAVAGISTQGTVKSLQDCGGDGSAMAKATILFIDHSGQLHLASTPWCANFVLDESLSIWYLADHPATIVTEHDLVSLVAFTGLITSFTLVLFAVFVKALSQRLQANPQPPMSLLLTPVGSLTWI